MVMMDGMVLWSSLVFDYGHIRRRSPKPDVFLFSLLFGTDLCFDTRECFVVVRFFQIRTVVVVHADWTLPYYAE